MLRPWDRPAGWSPRAQAVTLRPLPLEIDLTVVPDYDEDTAAPTVLFSEGVPDEA